MPTYHFRCEVCATVADRKLPFGSEEKPDCETCGKPMVKFIVPPQVQFKGSGFYKTDSAKKEPSTKPDTPKAPPAAAPSATKSE